MVGRSAHALREIDRALFRINLGTERGWMRMDIALSKTSHCWPLSARVARNRPSTFLNQPGTISRRRLIATKSQMVGRSPRALRKIDSGPPRINLGTDRGIDCCCEPLIKNSYCRPGQNSVAENATRRTQEATWRKFCQRRDASCRNCHGHY